MTDDERRLLVLVAEHLAELLEADAEGLDEEPAEADALRALIAKVQAHGGH